jgi:dihydrofolate reductase
MRKVIASTYATLDGRMEAIQKWVVPWNDDVIAAFHTDVLANSDGLLLGRKTYEVFAMIWPPRAGSLPYADKINAMSKYVASTTLKDSDLTWQNSSLIEGDAAAGVARLKEQPGQDLVVYGGHDFTNTLLESGLIDEYRLLMSPVMIGNGRGILKEGGKRVDLDLTDTKVVGPGVLILTYQVKR